MTELADKVGSYRQHISKYERGLIEPKLSLALKFGKVLGRSVEELFGNSGS